MIYRYRAGLCDEKSYLITAILRGAGIPVRVIHSSQLNHAWVEFFCDGSWIPVPSTGVLDQNGDGYVDMQERIAEDVVVELFYPTLRTEFVGYKYSVYGAELILEVARDEKWKEQKSKIKNRS